MGSGGGIAVDCGGSSITVSKGSSGVSVSNGSRDVVGVGDDRSSNSLPDNGLSNNRDRMGDSIGFVNMDGSGDLNNLLPENGDIIGDLNTSLNIDRLIDSVDLGLGLDNGSIDGLSSLKDCGDLNGKMRGSGLVDGGIVSRDIRGLTIVNLLGDDGSGLVNSGNAFTLGLSLVGGRDGYSRSGNCDCGSSSIGQMGRCSCITQMSGGSSIAKSSGVSENVGGSSVGAPKDEG